MTSNGSPIVEAQEFTNAGELERARKQRDQFDRNSAWLQQRISDVYSSCRGQCICVAGQELFVADNASDAIARATAAHPDDEGWFTRYIPKEKLARIYAV